MRSAGFALLTVCLVVGICWLLFHRGGSDGATETETGPRAQAVPVPTAEPSAPVHTPAPREVVPAADDREETQGDVVHIRGTVVAIDASGGEHREEDGTLSVLVWKHGVGVGQDVDVHRGRFALDPPAEDPFSFQGAILGGRPARVEPIRMTDALEVRATWVTPAILRVVDAGTGVDLTGITAIVAPPWSTPEAMHPETDDPANQRIVDGVSPLALTIDAKQLEWQESLWIGAHGYAWARVAVDYANPAERRVELQRGGTMEVRIEGRLPDATVRTAALAARDSDDQAPRLRLRRGAEVPDQRLQAALEQIDSMPDSAFGHDGQPTREQMRQMLRFVQGRKRGNVVFEAPVRLDASIVLEGMAPGDYLVAVELDDQLRTPLVLGESPANVLIDRTEHVVVHVEPPPTRAAVPLAGTLFLPPAWERRSFDLLFEPLEGGAAAALQPHRRLDLSDMTPDPTTPGLFHWDVGPMLPGRYLIKTFTIPLQWLLDTGDIGTDHAEIVVPDPVDVSVRVLEEATEREVDDAHVNWFGKWATGSMGGTFDKAKWNSLTRAYEFRGAVGSIQLSLGHQDYAYAIVGSSAFDVQPSSRELIVHVKRRCGVVVHLKQGDAVIPWDARYPLHLVTTDGKEVNGGWGGADDHAQYLSPDDPGSYRILVPDQPGFAPVPPIDIEIPAGTFVERDVQLQPRG